MKKQLIIGAAALVALAACSTDGFKTSDSGLKYKVEGKGEGNKAKEGDVLTLKMTYKVETSAGKDSVIFDSKMAQGGTIKVPVQKPSFKGSIEEGFMMLAPGDSGVFQVSADSLFEKTFHAPMPAFVKKGSVVTFEIKLVSLQTKEDMDKEMKAQQEVYMQQMQERKNKEPNEMAEYIKSNKVSAKPTTTGLYFIQTKAGNGAAVADGKVVKVNYVGKFLDGKVFDTNIEAVAKANNSFDERRPYEPLEITIGQKQVIAGMEEGLKMMKQGGKANLLMPSVIAYGANGAGGGFIPPFSPLVFEVELINVK